MFYFDSWEKRWTQNRSFACILVVCLADHSHSRWFKMSKRAFWKSLIIGTCFLAGCSHSGDVLEVDELGDQSQSMDHLMTAWHDAGRFNGAVLVAEQGKVVFENGYGFANFEDQVPNTPETRFRLASVSKQFTAMLTLQVVQSGELQLDGTVADYLPWYRKDSGGKITVHHLMTHTSGLPNYTAFSGFYDGPNRMSYGVKDFVLEYCSGDLEFEPGERYSYNNSGYYILGAILEEVTGQTYQQLVQERIFTPAGMNDSGYDDNSVLVKNRARGYQYDTEGDLQNQSYQDMSIYFSAGALYSTARDLYQWDQALYGDLLLGDQLKEKMLTPYKNDYGYGVGITKVTGHSDETVTRISHNGAYEGFNTYIARYLDDKNLIVILNNTDKTALSQIRDGLADILYGRPYDLPLRMFRLKTADGPGSLRVNRITSQGTIESDDCAFVTDSDEVGKTVYSIYLMLHDGENVYRPGTTGMDAKVIDGEIVSSEGSVTNTGITFSKTPGLTATLKIELEEESLDAESKLTQVWEFQNAGDKELPLRFLWFSDVDNYIGTNDAGDDLVAISKDHDNLVLGNTTADGKVDMKSAIVMTMEPKPTASFGVGAVNGAAKYWRSSGDYSETGPAASGYGIAPSIVNTVENDKDGDGMSDAGIDVAGVQETKITLAPGEIKTVTCSMGWAPRF